MAGPSIRLQNTKCGFYIDVTLTEYGQTEAGLLEVIRLIFAHLNKIKKKGARKFYIDEIRFKKLIEFRYQQKKPAKSAAIEFAYKLDAWEDDDNDKHASKLLI